MSISDSNICALRRLLLCPLLLLFSFAHAYRALTVAEPDLPLPELVLRLKPLTVDELWLEADSWRALLTAKIEQVSAAEIAIFRKNQAIDEAQGAFDNVEEARQQLGDARQAPAKVD